MAACRTLDEVIAAADTGSAAVPPLTQAAADQVAAILAPWHARQEPGRVTTVAP